MSLLSASCLRSSAQLVVLVTHFNIPHAAAERHTGHSGWHRTDYSHPASSMGLQGTRCYFPCSFSSFPGCLRPHCTLEGWKTLRFSYRLRVSSFAKLLDMRVRQDWRNHKSYQRHSSTFISLFPLSERSHMVKLNWDSFVESTKCYLCQSRTLLVGAPKLDG